MLYYNYMAKKSARAIVVMRSSESGTRILTTKNAKNTTDKLSLKKYDPAIRRHTKFNEVKAKLS